MDRNALIEALKNAKQNPAGQFEISEDVIAALVPMLKKDGRTIDGQKFEIATLSRMQDGIEEHLKQQFDSMQIGLIAHVMWKVNRQTLVIDSREINAGPFTHIVPSATMLDGYRTQYRLGKPGNH